MKSRSARPTSSAPFKLAVRQKVSANTRFLDFPWGSKVGGPLRELGVAYTGVDYLQPPYLAGTDASPTHLLYFVIAGAVEYATLGGFQPLAAGQWVICPACGPHWIRLAKGKAEALFFHLTDLPRWNFLRAHREKVFQIQCSEILKNLLVDAIREATSLEYGAFGNATAYSSILGTHLTREIDCACGRHSDPWRSRLSGLWMKVNAELASDWTVPRLASEIHISSSNLYTQTARHHGVKPMEMVTLLRIERAKDLLLHGTDTLDAIAAAVGYQTAYAFSAAFLRKTGQRPGHYRRTQGSPAFTMTPSTLPDSGNY